MKYTKESIQSDIDDANSGAVPITRIADSLVAIAKIMYNKWDKENP